MKWMIRVTNWYLVRGIIRNQFIFNIIFKNPLITNYKNIFSYSCNHDVFPAEAQPGMQGQQVKIMDGLGASGQVVPMIVEMDCGYYKANPDVRKPVMSNVTRVCIKDLIPFIDKTFRTKTSSDRST